MGASVRRRSRKGDKVEQSERKSGDVRFKRFERTVVEGLTAEEWDGIQEWMEKVFDNPDIAAQRAAEMRAYVALLLRHQNN